MLSTPENIEDILPRVSFGKIISDHPVEGQLFMSLYILDTNGLMLYTGKQLDKLPDEEVTSMQYLDIQNFLRYLEQHNKEIFTYSLHGYQHNLFLQYTDNNPYYMYYCVLCASILQVGCDTTRHHRKIPKRVIINDPTLTDFQRNRQIRQLFKVKLFFEGFSNPSNPLEKTLKKLLEDRCQSLAQLQSELARIVKAQANAHQETILIKFYGYLLKYKDRIDKEHVWLADYQVFKSHYQSAMIALEAHYKSYDEQYRLLQLK